MLEDYGEPDDYVAPAPRTPAISKAEAERQARAVGESVDDGIPPSEGQVSGDLADRRYQAMLRAKYPRMAAVLDRNGGRLEGSDEPVRSS